MPLALSIFQKLSKKPLSYSMATLALSFSVCFVLISAGNADGFEGKFLRSRNLYNFDCGCPSTCTQAVMETIATDSTGSHSCGSRISYLQSPAGGSLSKYDACVRVSNVEFLNICGPYCDPTRCSSQPSVAPMVPPPPPSPSATSSTCGCNSCTEEVLDTIAYDGDGGYSCGGRISYLQSPEGGSLSEYDACVRVSSADFPTVCGPHCDPMRCNPVRIPPAETDKLVWSDEFDVDGLPSSAKWDYDVGGSGWGNNELQYYTSRRVENAWVADGSLHIRAVRERYHTEQYTSARLVTKNKPNGSWKYGRMQVRARLLECTATGTWPAIWMLPTHWVYGGWPNSGEIDIMEHVGYDTGRVHGTVHTDAFNHMKGTQVGGSISTSVEDWHVYEITWDEDKIQFVLDSVRYHVFFRDSFGDFREWPFDQDFHLILNVAVGGMWGGVKGVDESAFEESGQVMEVDWVRIYSD